MEYAQSATVAINRIWGLLAIQPEVTDQRKPVAIEKASVEGRIDFDRITFGYEGGAPVIQDLDLHINPGEMIGIVGTTGAGKSSLISLLCRFYDVNEGSIRIDGIDIRELAQSDLHRMVGLVQQEPYLYSGTVLDNVRLFDETISRERVIEACRFIGADSIIMRMRKAMTPGCRSAARLVRRRTALISFARIIVFQPKILILDEATANLDSHTER